MSMFDSSDYRWRETYFVLFESQRRPSAAKIKSALKKLGGRFELSEVRADDQGDFESVTLSSAGDFAALDISYLAGEEVQLQAAELAKELRGCAVDEVERAKVALLRGCDARFDVMHFEQVAENGEAADEMFDPSALLIVVGALAELTQGVGVDPQSGTLV